MKNQNRWFFQWLEREKKVGFMIWYPNDKPHFPFGPCQWQVEAELLLLNVYQDISFHGPTYCNWSGTVDHKIGKDKVFHLKREKKKSIFKKVRPKNFQHLSLTRVDSHMSIPCRSIVQRFAANWTLLAFFGIAHARRSYFLHVVVQLQLLKKVKISHLLIFGVWLFF